MADVHDHSSPASAMRPRFDYAPRQSVLPLISIITPYRNAGPNFAEAVLSVTRSSFPHWEWIIVNDGTSSEESLTRLDSFCRDEPRARVVHLRRTNALAARNQGFADARGRYVLFLDSDEMIEPTFIEKALLLLETHPQFAICAAKVIALGDDETARRLDLGGDYASYVAHSPANVALVRANDWRASPGFINPDRTPEARQRIWPSFAAARLPGFVLPEYLIWDRPTPDEHPRILHSSESLSPIAQVRAALRIPPPLVPDPSPITPGNMLPFENMLAKPSATSRVLCLFPWMELGGADRFNIDMIRLLSAANHEFTVVTTVPSQHVWLAQFAALTPDIFTLDHVLSYSDYLRFLGYLITSRQIDAVLISNSELGYVVLPWLRAHFPRLAILDYNHMETAWKDGGHAGMSTRVGDLLDKRVVATRHLREWMVARDTPEATIRVCYCGIDTDAWNPAGYDRAQLRRDLGIADDEGLLLFIGRVDPQKRPELFAELVRQLTLRGARFKGIVAGVGPDLGTLKAFAHQHHLPLEFPGSLDVNQVRDVLVAGDVLLLPSQQEGLALVLYESLSMGTIPVAADVGGQGELVIPECGYLIPQGPDEASAYIAAVETLLNDPDLRERMRAKGRERVVAQFDQRLMAEGMIAAIVEAREAAARRGVPDKATVMTIEQASEAAVMALSRQDAADRRWFARQQIAKTTQRRLGPLWPLARLVLGRGGS